MEYVYFFRETGRPYVKIGMSKNEIQSRFKAFKTYAPLGAYIVGYIKTSNASLLEKEIHKKYNDKRLKGEFFNITDDEVYTEINIHDSKFGEVVSLLDYFVNEMKYDISKIKKILNENYKQIEEINLKYAPDEILLNFINDNKGKYFTNTQINNFLKSKGVILSQYALGIILNRLSIEKKRKKINGLSSLVYVF